MCPSSVQHQPHGGMWVWAEVWGVLTLFHFSVRPRLAPSCPMPRLADVPRRGGGDTTKLGSTREPVESLELTMELHQGGGSG